MARTPLKLEAVHVERRQVAFVGAPSLLPRLCPRAKCPFVFLNEKALLNLFFLGGRLPNRSQ